MDIVIFTGALDRSMAAVKSASDLTALNGPDDFPQLVIGTVEPITVKFVSAAGAYETWSADPTYTVVASIGSLSADGTFDLADGTLSTVITNGKSGNLVLTGTPLIDELGRSFQMRPRLRGSVFTLQITVTDPSGNRRAFAQLPVMLNGRVPS